MAKLATLADRTVQGAALFLAVIYLVSGILFLCFSYWDATEQDFWRIYDFALNYSWLGSAVFKYNNHSIFFPALLWLLDLRFFHGQQLMLFVTSLVLLLLSTALLLIPVWRVWREDFTRTCLATLAVIFGSFWMGRAMITTSGGFSCIASMVTLGAAVAFPLLSRMRLENPAYWRTTILIISAAYLASFSFGTGLALWPTLWLLGWSMRLPRRSLMILLFASLVVLIIYRLLPPPDNNLVFRASADSPGLLSVASLKNLCLLIGAPLLYSIAAWKGTRITLELLQTSDGIWLAGVAGLIFSIAVLVRRLIRRDLQGDNIEFIGVALIAFSLCTIILVVSGRVLHFQKVPLDVVAPRYLFWSSLFWTGVVLTMISAAHPEWLRWPCALFVFAIAIGGWQEHYAEGFHWRYARYLADEGATSLINGVFDPNRMLAPTIEQADSVVPQLRALRLDMFADGLHEWIGQPLARLFRNSHNEPAFRGRAAAERLVGGRDQAHAVKVVGQLDLQGTARNLVIVDQQGTVVGIARVFITNRLINRLLYGGGMLNGRLAGYIRDYDPASHYILRAVGNNNDVSEDWIEVRPLSSARTIGPNF